jgi:hypothetical protein
MKLVKIWYEENFDEVSDRICYELDPGYLTVEEFTRLSGLLDRCGVFALADQHMGPISGGHDISIVVETTHDGFYQISLCDTDLQGECRQLAEYIQELWQRHHPPDLHFHAAASVS